MNEEKQLNFIEAEKAEQQASLRVSLTEIWTSENYKVVPLMRL